MRAATFEEVAGALKRLGHFRVIRAQEVVEGEREGLGVDLKGSHFLALGLRETWGRNIEGGAKLVDGTWLPETDPARMDVGWLQISRRYHIDALRRMPGVLVGTWSPVVTGKTAADSKYVPRFTDALRYTADEFENSLAYARAHEVTKPIRFAIAAHNAGTGGALRGYTEGNIDKYTAGGDYAAWVLDARLKVVRWLAGHPDWIYVP